MIGVTFIFNKNPGKIINVSEILQILISTHRHSTRSEISHRRSIWQRFFICCIHHSILNFRFKEYQAESKHILEFELLPWYTESEFVTRLLWLTHCYTNLRRYILGTVYYCYCARRLLIYQRHLRWCLFAKNINATHFKGYN